NQRRGDHRLERSGITEVESRQQGRVVERERDARDADGGKPGPLRHGTPVAQRPARLAAMAARTASSGRVFSTCRGSTQPRRAIVTPNAICRSSLSAAWQSLSTANIAPAATA